jgi:hypothetical protein
LLDALGSQVLAGLDEFCDEEDRLEERLGLFAWLHASLPGNVKVVLSVTQDGPALIQLKEELDQESFVFIPSMVRNLFMRHGMQNVASMELSRMLSKP